MEVNHGCVRLTVPVTPEMEKRLEKLTEAQIAFLEKVVVDRFPSIVAQVSGYIENIVVTTPAVYYASGGSVGCDGGNNNPLPGDPGFRR